jgi:hypothetical protein
MSHISMGCSLHSWRIRFQSIQRNSPGFGSQSFNYLSFASLLMVYSRLARYRNGSFARCRKHHTQPYASRLLHLANCSRELFSQKPFANLLSQLN